MAPKGGSVGVTGRGGPGIRLDITLSGFERASDDLKQARRDANQRIRGAVETAGRMVVLPAIQHEFPKQGWRGVGEHGLPSGAMAASLYVRRDRSAVIIGSRLRGSLNRALGWIDFGGRRPNDSQRRSGPHVIVGRLDDQREHIDQAILKELLKAFGDLAT